MGRRPIAISDENREVPLQEHRVMLIVRCLTPIFSYILKKAAHFKSRTPTIQSTHQSANHTVFTPKTDPDHTDSGGLKPTAINPEHWDLVPPSGAHRLPPKCDGVWAIRRHKQPSGRALRRAGAAGKSSWQRALTAFSPTFVLQRENQPVKAGHGSCAFAQPHCGAMGGRARAHQSSKSLLVLVGRPQPVKARKK